MDRVALLGAGSWGTALTTLLPHVAEVRLWARDRETAAALSDARENVRYLPGVPLPPNVHVTASLRDAVREADAVVFAVPSAAMHDLAAAVAPFLPPETLLVSAAKGLEAATGKRMSEVIADALIALSSRSLPRIAALSGPNLAVEVANGIPTASVAAARDDETARSCQNLFMGATFRVYASRDLLGVELAGAMKNVIAIAAGICDGMGFGDNSRAALMTRGLAEITRLGVTLGADPTTFLGLAGVGDLIATSSSRLSRNYRVGVGLGKGDTLATILAGLGQVAEGIPTTRAIHRLSRTHAVEMPIVESLYAALFEDAALHAQIYALMRRPARSEADF